MTWNPSRVQALRRPRPDRRVRKDDPNIVETVEQYLEEAQQLLNTVERQGRGLTRA